MAYLTLAQFYALGLRSQAVSSVSTGDLETAVEGASVFADSYLGARYTLPLTSWGDDLRRAVGCIAAYDALSVRGLSPSSSGADENVRDRYTDAVTWLKGVAAGSISPRVTDSTPTDESDDGMTAAVSNAPRRWNNNR